MIYIIMYSGENDVCGVALSLYPRWDSSAMLCQLSYAFRSVRVCDVLKLRPVPLTSA